MTTSMWSMNADERERARQEAEAERRPSGDDPLVQLADDFGERCARSQANGMSAEDIAYVLASGLLAALERATPCGNADCIRAEAHRIVDEIKDEVMAMAMEGEGAQ
jgi:hypothetical protein